MVGCAHPQSWQAAGRNLQTESTCCGGQAIAAQGRAPNPRAVEPRAVHRMARIGPGVIRGAFREWVREATSLTFLFDERHGYEMVLFRCDAPSPDSEGTKDGIAARSGLLGIDEMLTGVTLEELAKDYAERVVEDLRLLCARFCTPLGTCKTTR